MKKAGWWLAAALIVGASCGGRPDPLPGFPSIVLWAWERPERLPFLDLRLAGVAFLALTVSWRDGGITFRPRYQPLEVPPGTPVIAVTRLESDPSRLPGVEAVADAILKTAALPRVKAVEIDFDARLSERDWYTRLLQRVRQRLDRSVPLTMTALTSWCLGDPWIQDLPVADAVPMLFRMGPGQPRDIRDFRLELCRASVGVSTDEEPVWLPRGRRLFVFNPAPWTRETYSSAMRWARRWQ